MSDSSDSKSPETQVEPILIDLGKRKRKQVKKLRRGKPGRLMDEVQKCIEELKSNDTIAQDAQPVIVVIRQKEKNFKLW